MNRSFQAEYVMCAKAAHTAAGDGRVATGRGERAEFRPAAGTRPREFLQVGNNVGQGLVLSLGSPSEKTGPHSGKPPLGLVQRLSYHLLR